MPPEEQRPAGQDGAPSVPAAFVVTSEGIVADHSGNLNGTLSQSLAKELLALADHSGDLIAARIQAEGGR